MKKKESDTGNELYYAQFPGIEFIPYGVWTEDRNNIPPCEWTMSDKEYREWFYSVHPKPVDVRQATRYWLDRREMLWTNPRILRGILTVPALDWTRNQIRKRLRLHRSPRRH